MAGVGLIGLGGLVLVPLQANPVPYLLRVRLDWLFYLMLTVGGLGGLIVQKISNSDQKLDSVTNDEQRTRNQGKV